MSLHDKLIVGTTGYIRTCEELEERKTYGHDNMLSLSSDGKLYTKDGKQLAGVVDVRWGRHEYGETSCTLELVVHVLIKDCVAEDVSLAETIVAAPKHKTVEEITKKLNELPD